MHDEMLDLVDANDHVIATMPRSEVFAQQLKNFRVVCALLKNPEGKLFIPRRSFNKSNYVGNLCCVGGCVQSGESYEEALHRETLEEVMIDVSTTSYKLLGYLSPFEYTVNGYVAVYEILVHTTEINYAQNDFCEGFWLLPQQLKELINCGEKATPNLVAIIQQYY